MIFRQMFDPASSTYTYLLADGGYAVLIDPVFEQVRRDGAEDFMRTLAAQYEQRTGRPTEPMLCQIVDGAN